jgi:hypothetical protein
MIQNVTLQSSSQEFVQLYSTAPRDLSFLRSFIPTFELLDWDPSHGITSYFLELNADLIVTKTAQSVSRYAYRFLEPGIMLLDPKKGLGCHLPQDATSLKEFLSEENLNQMKKLVSDVEEQMNDETKAEIKTKAARGYLGCKVVIEDRTGVYFGMKLANFEYFKQAIDYLQEKFTVSENFWNQSDEESSKILFSAHCFLSGGISYARTKDWMIIPEEEVDGKKSYNLQKLAKENSLSEDDTVILKKLELFGRVPSRNEYTQEEERVMNLIAFLPTKVSEILPSMQSFVRKLKSGYSAMQKIGKMNYIKLAAIAHQSITKIQAFENNNDRFARVLVTALLMQGGYDPIVFHNENEYMEEVRKSGKDLKGFEKYLERCVQMTEGLQGELAALS